MGRSIVWGGGLDLGGKGALEKKSYCLYMRIFFSCFAVGHVTTMVSATDGRGQVKRTMRVKLYLNVRKKCFSVFSKCVYKCVCLSLFPSVSYYSLSPLSLFLLSMSLSFTHPHS
jgi:hypothetical protein